MLLTGVRFGCWRVLLVPGAVPLLLAAVCRSIRYNIRYGRMAASDTEVEDAAEAAAIHEPISTRFPKVCSPSHAVCPLSLPCRRL